MADNEASQATPDMQQIIGYVKHQASKSNAELVALVERGADYVDGTLEAVSEAQACVCPEPGEWCICDVLRHLTSATHGTARIVEALSAGKEADIAGIEPVVKPGLETMAELRQGLAESFEHLRTAVGSMPEGAESNATSAHPFFGPLTGREWAVFGYVHARDHGMQIEAVKAKPDFPG